MRSCNPSCTASKFELRILIYKFHSYPAHSITMARRRYNAGSEFLVCRLEHSTFPITREQELHLYSRSSEWQKKKERRNKFRNSISVHPHMVIGYRGNFVSVKNLVEGWIALKLAESIQIIWKSQMDMSTVCYWNVNFSKGFNISGFCSNAVIYANFDKAIVWSRRGVHIGMKTFWRSLSAHLPFTWIIDRAII